METASWIRCPVCRTRNAKATLPCLGCGGSLANAPACRPGEALEIHRQVQGDRRRSNAALVALACFGGLGVLMILEGMALFSMPLAVAVIVFVVLVAGGGLLLARLNDPAFEAAGRIALRGLAVIGTLFLTGVAVAGGLLIYLFIACASSLRR